MTETKLTYGKDGFSVNKKSDDLSKKSDDELRELKGKGKIVYKPAKTKDGKRERTLDNKEYTVGPGGQRKLAMPKQRMSKKQRRRLREAAKGTIAEGKL